MKSFYAYLPSGEIVATGMCADGDLDIQKYPGAEVVEGNAVYGNDYVGSNGELLRIPDSPGTNHKFNYLTKQWEPQPEKAWDAVKETRTRLLNESDWVIVKAQETGNAVSQEWSEYRQALRDITQQTDPWNIVWPIKP